VDLFFPIQKFLKLFRSDLGLEMVASATFEPVCWFGKAASATSDARSGDGSKRSFFEHAWGEQKVLFHTPI
jgi:hypothetical protein